MMHKRLSVLLILALVMMLYSCASATDNKGKVNNVPSQAAKVETQPANSKGVSPVVDNTSDDDSELDAPAGYYTTENGTIVNLYVGQPYIGQADGKIHDDVDYFPLPVGPALKAKFFPPNPEAEAAIVYDNWTGKVIIEGKTYEGNQLSVFNGKVLAFTTGKDGTLYAFTTPEKEEQFFKEEYGDTFPDTISISDIFSKARLRVSTTRHPVLPWPVIVDGKTYEGNQLSLFKGTRLWYAQGKDGKMYAFTTLEKVKQFNKEQRK